MRILLPNIHNNKAHFKSEMISFISTAPAMISEGNIVIITLYIH